MFENNETGVERSNVAHYVLPVLKNLLGRGGSSVDVVVWGRAGVSQRAREQKA